MFSSDYMGRILLRCVVMFRGDVNERRRVYRLNGSLYIVIYCVFVLYLIVIFV